MYGQPSDPQPRSKLRHDVKRRVLRAAEGGVVPFPHRVVLPPIDVHRARPLKAGDPVRRQVVEPQVTYLQSSNLIYPQACQSCHGRQQARPVRRQRRGPPCEQPPHSSLLDRQLQCQRPTADRAQHLDPRRVLVSLAERLAELKLPVTRLNRLPHQLDLRARDCEANHIPCQGLERVQRHGQDIVHRLARHRPCDDQPPRPPIVRPRARLPARRREVLVEGRRQRGTVTPADAW